MNNATDLPTDRWFAMTRLDENRAKTQLAQKAGVHSSQVKNLAIWGNHSSTMYPDFYNATIDGKPTTDVITDESWFADTFIPIVQQRGAAIIKARGLSSAASAANAAIDTVKALITPTAEGDCFSVGVCSDGSYGIEKGLIYSFPIRSDGSSYEIIQDVPVNDFSQNKITETENELKEEKSMVADLL
jgi:malate dehydrogenase